MDHYTFPSRDRLPFNSHIHGHLTPNQDLVQVRPIQMPPPSSTLPIITHKDRKPVTPSRESLKPKPTKRQDYTPY